jgi:hypothetical protein
MQQLIAKAATARVLAHLGEGVQGAQALTPSEKLINAIFGVERTREEIAANTAAEAAAKAAAWDQKAAAEKAAKEAAAAAKQAEIAACREAEDAPAIARVAMVNAAIAALLAEGVLADHDYADQPRVWGLYWSERKRQVLDGNSHNRSPEAWALYEAIKAEGTTCPERAADMLAEICGLLQD